jgi:hypothetical protein
VGCGLGKQREQAGLCRPIRERKRGREILSFFFSEFSKSIFEKNFESLFSLVKTTRYKNKNAAACMHQHVSILIFDFSFINFIIIFSIFE